MESVKIMEFMALMINYSDVRNCEIITLVFPLTCRKNRAIVYQKGASTDKQISDLMLSIAL